jgi:PIN domain nuclease of toxin-antitoxin system
VTALLLDTNQLILLAQNVRRVRPQLLKMLDDPRTLLWMSIVSFWEMQIKYDARNSDGARRLELAQPPDAMLRSFQDAGVTLLPLNPAHVFALLDPELGHADPFDLMLLKQCQIENLRLLSSDKKLHGQPLCVAA